MSVHGALEAWQAGKITAARAIALTGAENLFDLYALAAVCDVAIRTEPTTGKRAAADATTEAIRRANQRIGAEEAGAAQSTAAGRRPDGSAARRASREPFRRL